MRESRMILVIGGPPGSGKTTAAERWAATHRYILVSAGTKFRAMAKERGMGLEAFGRAAEKDPSIDRALDRAILEEIRAKQAAGANVVVDGRIQAHLLSKEDRKSTRLNSSHVSISYAVFCLKKKRI